MTSAVAPMPELGQMHTAKLVLLGEMGAGKSSLVLRFVKGQFFDYQASTVGAAFLTKSLPELSVKFEIWDTAGQERYHSLAPMYYRGAAAAVIVYDVTSADSFSRAKAWVAELQRQGTPGLVMALAGNKADLEAQRAVGAEEAAEYAREQGLHFAETSAKTALNVEGLFLEVARRLPRPGAAGAGAGAAGEGAAGAEGGAGRINLGAPAAGAAGAKKVGGCC